VLRPAEGAGRPWPALGVVGSGRGSFKWFHAEKIELPVNKAVGGHFQLVQRAFFSAIRIEGLGGENYSNISEIGDKTSKLPIAPVSFTRRTRQQRPHARV